MKWQSRRRSDNVIDQRGSRFGGRRAKVGGGMTLILLLIGLIFGSDVQNIASLLLGGSGAGQQAGQYQDDTRSTQQNDEASEFVRVILAETEDTWGPIFRQMGREYRAPKLVLYSGMIQSACGVGSAQAGPFYCPGDYKVYIDLSFLNQLRQMGAPGDFAFAYVIAHEVGHHVQNLVGIARQVQTQKQQVSKVQANALSVRMELQADCLAGIWINHTEKRKSILEAGDIEEGLNAAAAVGDDRIMKSAGRAVHREAFTHGSSAERVNWFKRGMQTGDLNACNTFG
jgi:predicted metalloprotease